MPRGYGARDARGHFIKADPSPEAPDDSSPPATSPAEPSHDQAPAPTVASSSPRRIRVPDHPPRLVLVVDNPPTPAAPGVIPPEPPPAEPAPEAEAENVALLRLAAEGVNGLLSVLAKRPDLRAGEPELDRVSAAAEPVVRRLAAHVNAEGAADAALPEPAAELVKLGAAVLIAWGEALGELARFMVAHYRARREELENDDSAGASAGGYRDRRPPNQRDADRRDAPRGTMADRAPGVPGLAAQDRPDSPGQGYGDFLAAATRRRGGR
jgi:hypothetical protein